MLLLLALVAAGALGAGDTGSEVGSELSPVRPNGLTHADMDARMSMTVKRLDERLKESERVIAALQAKDVATTKYLKDVEAHMTHLNETAHDTHTMAEELKHMAMDAQDSAHAAQVAANASALASAQVAAAHAAFKRTLLVVEAKTSGAAASGVIARAGSLDAAAAVALAAQKSVKATADIGGAISPVLIAAAAASATASAATAHGLDNSHAAETAAEVAAAVMQALGESKSESAKAAFQAATEAGADAAQASASRLAAWQLFEFAHSNPVSKMFTDALAHAPKDWTPDQLRVAAEGAANKAQAQLVHAGEMEQALVAATSISITILVHGGSESKAAEIAALAAEAAKKAAENTISSSQHAQGAEKDVHGVRVRRHLTAITKAKAWVAAYAAEALLALGGTSHYANQVAHAAAAALQHVDGSLKDIHAHSVRGPLAYQVAAAAASATRASGANDNAAARVAAQAAVAAVAALGGDEREASAVAAASAFRAGGGTEGAAAAAGLAQHLAGATVLASIEHALDAGQEAAEAEQHGALLDIALAAATAAGSSVVGSVESRVRVAATAAAETVFAHNGTDAQAAGYCVKAAVHEMGHAAADQAQRTLGLTLHAEAGSRPQGQLAHMGKPHVSATSALAPLTCERRLLAMVAGAAAFSAAHSGATLTQAESVATAAVRAGMHSVAATHAPITSAAASNLLRRRLTPADHVSESNKCKQRFETQQASIIAHSVARASAVEAGGVGITAAGRHNIAGMVASAVENAIGSTAANAAAAAASASRAAGATDSQALKLAVQAELMGKLFALVPEVLGMAHHAVSVVLRSGGTQEYAAELASVAAMASTTHALKAAQHVSSRLNVTDALTYVHGEIRSAAASFAALVPGDTAEIVGKFAATGAESHLHVLKTHAEQSLDTHTKVEIHHDEKVLAALHLPKHCRDAPIPSNGLGIGLGWDTNDIGTQVSFKCNWGFSLQGSQERTCQTDGTWSGEPTFCIFNTESPTPSPTPPPTPPPTPSPTPQPRCPVAVAPHFSVMSGGGHVPGDHLFFMCQSPAELVGPPRAVCEADVSAPTGASWTDFPVCAHGVKTCSHIKCRSKEHSTLLKVRVEVNHGTCRAHEKDVYAQAGICDELHGDKHYCRVNHDGDCVCKCWFVSDKGDDFHPLNQQGHTS